MDGNSNFVTDVHNSRPAIFLHIPKTAGTTLHNIIERQYPPEAIYTFGSNAHAAVEDFKNRSLQERNQIRLLRGHMAFGLHKYLPSVDDYFTVLREPVNRVISYYNFILRTPDHYLYEIVRSRNLSLSDLLHSQLPLMMNDAQVRLLSGVWGEVAFGEVSEAMLKMAEENLRNHFVVVGVTQEFDKTLCLLQAKLNWNSNILYERQNVTTQGLLRQQLPHDTIELIRQTNQKDIALYNYGQILFAQQMNEQGILFPLKVRLFQARNRWKPTLLLIRSYSIIAFIRNKLGP